MSQPKIILDIINGKGKGGQVPFSINTVSKDEEDKLKRIRYAI